MKRSMLFLFTSTPEALDFTAAREEFGHTACADADVIAAIDPEAGTANVIKHVYGNDVEVTIHAV